MDVSLVNDEVVLEPDVPGEVLVDVVNTGDVIDAVQVDVDGVPGTVVHLGDVVNLFPGERRRLPLRVQLPTQVPAGRHRLDVRVSTSAGQILRQAGLIVNVWPKPALAAVVRPSIQRALWRVTFPVVVVNRGNTPLTVQPRELDVPDRLRVTFVPDQVLIGPWQSRVCNAEVVAPRYVVGSRREHVLDLRVIAWSSSPGHPLREEELSQDVRVTFRQRPLIGTGLLFALALILVLVLWGTLGYLGLRTFDRSAAAPLTEATSLDPRSGQAGESDVSITISGHAVSGVDGSPMGGVTVLACSQDPDPQYRPACHPGTAAKVLSGSDGQFVLAGLFPGPYQLRFLPTGTGSVTVPADWYDSSCSLTQRLPSRPGTLSKLYAVEPGDPAPTGSPGSLPPARPEVLVKVVATVSSASPSPTTPPTAAAPTPTTTVTPTRPCGPVAAPSPAPKQKPKQKQLALGQLWVTPRSDGSFTTEPLKLAALPAPGHYDLTITAGSACAVMKSVSVSPGDNSEVLTATLSSLTTAAGGCAS